MYQILDRTQTGANGQNRSLEAPKANVGKHPYQIAGPDIKSGSGITSGDDHAKPWSGGGKRRGF